VYTVENESSYRLVIFTTGFFVLHYKRELSTICQTGMKGADDQTIAATRPSVRLSV